MTSSSEPQVLPATTEQLQAEIERRFKGTEYFRFAKLWSPKQKKLLTETKRPFIFLHGGNGAGKTTLGSYWAAMPLIPLNPLTGELRENVYGERYNIYAVGPKYDHVKQNMMPAMRKWLPKGHYKEHISDRMWVDKEDQWAIFWKSVDQGVDAFQGVEINRAWVDEEPKDADVWSEILARTFRRLAQVMVTMTAHSGTAWLHSWIFSPDEYPMEEKLLVSMAVDENPYYGLCNCNHAKMEHANKGPCQFSGCRCPKFDNGRGRQKLKRMMAQYHGIEFQIRCKGQYLLLAGKPVIAPEVRERHESRQANPQCGYLDQELVFVDCRDPEDDEAWLRVLQPPEPGVEYIIGADVGGGNPVGDYHAAVVLRGDTGQQIALIHTRSYEPRNYGLFLVQTARWYNDAFVVVEANNHGISAIDRMYELQYGNLYLRQHLESSTGKVSEKKGFWTDKKTKPTAVNLMVHLLSRDDVRVYDPIIVGEMYHYTWLKENREGNNGIGAASAKAHDDAMTALFLACWGYAKQGLVMLNPRRRGIDTADKVNPPAHQITVIDAIEADLAAASQSIEERDLLELDGFQEQVFKDLGGEEDVHW